MALLRSQSIRKLVNNRNRYVCLKIFKRDYIWNYAREHNRYEYSSSELANCLKKLESIGSSPIKQDNIWNYLTDCVKHNDFQTKEDILLMINAINYAFKSNQTIKNVIPTFCSGEKMPLSRFVAQVELHINDMTFDESVSALIAFSSINISLSSSVSRQLTVAVGKKMRESTLLPLLQLTNLAIFSRQHSDQMYPYLFCADGTSHILTHLNECRTIHDLYFISIYMDTMRKVFPKEILNIHVSKMRDLMLKIDPKQHIKELLRILVFYKQLSSTNLSGKVMADILLFISDAIPHMSNEELQRIANFQDVVGEPVLIAHRVLEVAESRPDKFSDIHLLYCRSASHFPDDVAKVSADIQNYMKSVDFKDIKKNRVIMAILKFKSHLNLREVNRIYWKKLAEDISSKILTYHETSTMLPGLSAQYWRAIRQFANMGDCAEYENHFYDLAMMDIKHGSASLQPRFLAGLTPAILSFASNENNFDIIPRTFVENIEKMSPQFGMRDVSDLAAGIDAFNRTKIRNTTNKRTDLKGSDYLNRISNVMNDSIERLMSDKEMEIESMCHLIRASASQRASRRNRTQERLIECIEERCSNPSCDVAISSRTIQNVTRSLYQMNYAVPNLCGKMLTYVNSFPNNVSADTAARLLFHLFTVGYEPDRELGPMLSGGDIDDRKRVPSKKLNAEFFDFGKFVKIIHRDFNLTPAWLIIQSCIALGFYQALPSDLINRVFNLEFITRVEKETLNNCDKVQYPKNILNMMMRLNRIVCLEYPEAAIPWFQQNFIEASRTLSYDIERNAYFKDVYNLLLKLVGGEKSMIRLNHIAPYGYRIPFVIYFNSRKELVPPPFDEGPQVLNKVAIVPLGATAYCTNEETRLRGGLLLQERHLGILGYDVVQICYREWNAIFMNLPGARENLLRNFLRNYHLLIE